MQLDSNLILTYLSDPLMLLFLILVIILIIFIAVILILRHHLRYRSALKSTFHNVILSVRLPKEAAEEKERKEITKEMIQEGIATAEGFFSTLGGMPPQKGISKWFLGRTDQISLEIVAQNKLISFFVAVPRKLQKYVESQIQGHYPEAFIEEVPDYNIFAPKGSIIGSYLTLRRQNFFPIKTYKKMEFDPLNSLTNILSKVEEGSGVAIQMMLRPAKKNWGRKGKKVAWEMQQGKKLNQAIKAATGNILVQAFRELGKIFSAGAKSKDKNQLEPKKEFKMSPMEEEMAKGLEEKISKAGMEVNIRVVASAPEESQAEMYLENTMNAFSQFNIYQYGNSFIRAGRSKKLVEDFIYRHFFERKKIILNTEELASIYHFPAPWIETPNIQWLLAKKAAPPSNLPTEGLILGKCVYRGVESMVRIQRDDRRRHVYIIGKSGTGKSWLIANMARQDIRNGEGICIIDPHGDLIEDVIADIPKERVDDVIYFDPSDMTRPMGFNLLEYDPDYPEQKTFLINEMINIFDKLYDLKTTGGPMFEQYMRNALLLIMEHPESGSTLLEVSRVLADEKFRHFKITHCKNQPVSDFWVKEAEKAGGEAALSNMTPYITSKLTQFIANDIMRPIIAQQKSAFNFRKLMDEKKILLINLSKGKIGDMSAYLLGLIIVGKILIAALSRVDLPQEERSDFYLYIDEFQNFITDSISTILSEARKYRLDLIIAHQYIGQLVRKEDKKIREAVFGNVGTMISYRVGVEDAEILSKEFAPTFNQYDVMNVEMFTANIKLLIDNQASKAFNMKTLPLAPGNKSIAESIKELSRLKYGRDRAVVEQEIAARSKIGEIRAL